MRQKHAWVAVAGALVQVGAAAAQDVRNEGAGDRRAALDAMVFKPAPIEQVLAQGEWIGSAPTAADLSGKVVLVLTWSEWYKPSHAAAMLGQRLHDKHVSDGLVVIGVHDKEGWEGASDFAAKRKLTFPVVRDANGSVRAALKVDQDPDIYVIDRAGNLRYADITTETAQAAVEALLGEDQSGAAGAQGAQEAERARQRAEARRSGAINQSVTLENLPAIPFTKPSAEAYAGVDWPKIDEALLREAQSIEELTPALPIPDGEWMNGKPTIDGKVIVVYTWHPISRTIMNDLMNRMEDLHKQRGRDVAVLGVMMPSEDQNRSGDRTGLVVDPTRDVPISPEGLRFSLGNRKLTQPMIAGGFAPPQIGRNRSNEQEALGTVYIASTDGRVRRAVHWSNWGQVQQAIDHLLRVDPGVKARREAEEMYIRGRGG